MTLPAIDLNEIKMNLGGLSFLGRLKAFGDSEPYAAQVHENQFELLYMHSGRKTFYIENSRYILNGGEALLILPGERHRADGGLQNRNTLYYLRFFDPLLYPSFCDLSDDERKALAAMLRTLKNRLIPVSFEMKKSFNELFSLTKGHCPIREARIKCSALNVIWQTIQRQNIRSDKPEDIRSIEDYIQQNESEMPSVSDLAVMVHLSVPKFVQKFIQVTGVPPVEYIIKHKIGLAEKKLVSSDKSITDIAFDLGFASGRQFSIVFEKYNGESPLHFRLNSETGYNSDHQI